MGITDINWIIVGDGMSRKWVEGEVESAGLKNNFFFEGFKPMSDIPRYTGISDLLIGCLVKSELLEATIPAKVMSYLAAGKPMALAMDGEVQALINTTIKCGYAGEAGDATQLSDNIKKIYNMPPQTRELMGIRGRNYHLHYFERNIIFDRLYEFLMKNKQDHNLI